MDKMKAYEIYINEILKWNKVHKLISKGDESKIFERHIKNAEEIFDKIKDFNIREIADVGAGAGFFGVVFSMLDETLKVSLIEFVAKKCAFLEYVKIKLGLKYEVLCKDANKLGRKFESTIERALGKPTDITRTMENLSEKYVFLVLGENENLEPIRDMGYKDIKLKEGHLAFKSLKGLQNFDTVI
ncbi:RsmG family class I SAM-dependent methyltransferase [Hydrogenobaculum acidophilum]